MAWTGLVLTVEGRNALNQAQLAGRINFKSIVVGDGAAPVNFRTLKGLVHQLYEITDIKVDMTEEGCTITADFPKVEYDYYFREIGVIVSTDEGDKLYVYDNCEDDAQYIVSSTGVETTKKRIRLSLAISDVAEIAVSAAEILYVAYDDYEETVEALKQNLREENERVETVEKSLVENLQNEIRRAEAAEETNKTNLEAHTADKANPHEVTKVQVGLGNVNNTSDVNKPVSIAQQRAIDSAYQQATGYTDSKIADLVGSAPETLDTLKEVADAIQANKDVSIALDAAIGKKANQAELDTHTGNSTIHITAEERKNWNKAKNHADSAHARSDATKTEKSNTNGNIQINGAETSVYTHPTTNGNKHIPAGGSAGKILRWSAAGTAVWGDDNNTTYSTATQSANGLLSAADKKKLDGIEAEANKITVDSAVSDSSTNPVQNKVIKNALDSKAASSHTHNYAGASSAGGSANSAVKLDSSAGSATQPVYFKDGKPVSCSYTLGASVPNGAEFTDTTYSSMSGASASADGKAGLVPAPAKGKQTSFLRGDGTWATPTDTNTWRGITDSLTSTDNTISLSAKAGKSLKDAIDTINGKLTDVTHNTHDVIINGVKFGTLEEERNGHVVTVTFVGSGSFANIAGAKTYTVASLTHQPCKNYYTVGTINSGIDNQSHCFLSFEQNGTVTFSVPAALTSTRTLKFSATYLVV